MNDHHKTPLQIANDTLDRHLNTCSACCSDRAGLPMGLPDCHIVHDLMDRVRALTPKSPEVTITINGAAFNVSAYRASFIAESLIEGGQEWEETAVDCARRNMTHPDAIGGYHGDFEAAADAREMANTHAMLATALLHAVDDGNSHHRCDVATCEKAQERASKLRERSKLSERTMIPASPLRDRV